MVGPYPIIAKEGYSFRVKLPALIKIHLVFTPNLLYKDKNNPLSGQVHEPEPPLQVMDDYKWEVNELLAVKETRNQLSYCVDWLGHNKDPE
jgi:hypothetical protein